MAPPTIAANSIVVAISVWTAIVLPTHAVAAEDFCGSFFPLIDESHLVATVHDTMRLFKTHDMNGDGASDLFMADARDFSLYMVSWNGCTFVA